MKINQNVTFLNHAASAPLPAVTSTRGSAPANASAAEPAAVISHARRPLTTGDFDAARVAEIRESIRAGSYQVNTARIADGLISSVRDLLGKT